MSKHRILTIILVIVSLIIGFIGGSYFQARQIPAPVVKNLINKEVNQPKDVDFSIFWTAWDLVHSKYVDKNKLDTQNLVFGAIEGMIKAIGDPYTVFFRPKESKEFNEQISGSFSGIGIEIGLRDDILTVIAPIKNTPAARAGILAGDKILKIDDKTTEGMKLDEAVSLIRGPKGTRVKLTIRREKAKETEEITIIRDIIKIPAVEWKLLEGDIAYVEILTFNKNVDPEFEKVAGEIVNSNAKKIILDLRNNPGGLLDSAINIAGYFLDADKIVAIEKFGDGKEEQFKTNLNGRLKNYPLVVLINKGSASASEILSGALKDNRGVLIIGETSFGKGSVQEMADLPQKSSLKITIAKWLIPSGKSIDENGIKPDIEVKMTDSDIKEGKDPQLDKAIEIIRNL
jgi:carboxyl-terminal processing protease